MALQTKHKVYIGLIILNVVLFICYWIMVGIENDIYRQCGFDRSNTVDVFTFEGKHYQQFRSTPWRDPETNLEISKQQYDKFRSAKPEIEKTRQWKIVFMLPVIAIFFFLIIVLITSNSFKHRKFIFR